MNLPYLAYNSLVSGIFASLLPPALLIRWARRDMRSFIDQRLGLKCPPAVRVKPGLEPRIWIHAVSVGEVAVAEVLMDALLQHLCGSRLVLSTSTRQGLMVARRRVGKMADCFYAPLDVIPAVRRVLAAVQPQILVCLETELWPNLLAETRKFGARIAVVNGRLSLRSVGRYRKMIPMMRRVLENVDLFSMVSREDALRIESIGAPGARIHVNGNAKFDIRLPAIPSRVIEAIRQRYGLEARDMVLVAGSTRQGEEKVVLEAFRKISRRFPGAVLVIAPRHVERASQVSRWAAEKGFAFQLHSALGDGRKRQAKVIIVDTMGDLFQIYSTATVVFCGGSLVPLGGQNILEPAAWGKPVLYGPYMDDFIEARAVLEGCGAGQSVATEDDLVRKVLEIFDDPVLARSMGRAARQVLSVHQGAAARHADVIRSLWQPTPDRSLQGKF